MYSRKAFECCKFEFQILGKLNKTINQLLFLILQKPLEPEKPGKLETVEVFEPVQVRTPINIISVERPDFNSPLTKVTPKIAQTLIDQVNKLQPNTRKLSELEYVFL